MPDSEMKKVLDRDGFLFGMVVPWFDSHSYGCDIGIHPRADQCNFSYERVSEVFYNCRSIGFNCVRIWLFEIMEGIVFDKDGFAIGMEDHFLKNLHTIYEIAESMNLNLLITFQPHISFSMSFPEPYKFYTQIIHKPEYTKSYIDHVVIPLAKYFHGKEHILMLDVYAEPEGDTQGMYGNQHQPYGGTWEQMHYYIKSVLKALREYAPGIPTTACSGWVKYDALKAGYYNNLDYDYIGIDIYNDTGEVEVADTLGCDKPLWLAEFGAETKFDWSEEFLSDVTLSFYDNAIKNGYIGAFFWMYGFQCEKGEALSIISRDGELRPAADKIRYFINDWLNQYRYQKQMPDIPAFLYFNSCSTISWLASRQAGYYILERTEDLNNWTSIATINKDPSNPDKRIAYSDLTAQDGIRYFYRITAVTDRNEKIFSNLSAPCKTN